MNVSSDGSGHCRHNDLTTFYDLLLRLFVFHPEQRVFTTNKRLCFHSTRKAFPTD